MEYIIRNPVYIGKLRWKPGGAYQTGLLQRETSSLRMASMSPSSTWTPGRKPSAAWTRSKAQWGYKARPSSELKHWLSGIVRCSACGATLIFAKPPLLQVQQLCQGPLQTHAQHIRVDLLEDAVISRLEQDASSSADIAYDITYTNSSEGPGAHPSGGRPSGAEVKKKNAYKRRILQAS